MTNLRPGRRNSPCREPFSPGIPWVISLFSQQNRRAGPLFGQKTAATGRKEGCLNREQKSAERMTFLELEGEHDAGEGGQDRPPLADVAISGSTRRSSE